MARRTDSGAKVDIDEGSWAYLIASNPGNEALPGLRESLVGACEESGWSAVDRFLFGSAEHYLGPGDLLEGAVHAVRHADLVLAVIEGREGAADAELACALSQGRPIVGVRISGVPAGDSATEEMLKGHERVRMVECDGIDSCSRKVRATFSDPDFTEMVRQAAAEVEG